MIVKKRLIQPMVLILLIVTHIVSTEKWPRLKGPYLGQKPPGKVPEVFAPGIVSTKEDEYAFEMSPSGNEMLFTRGRSLILITKNQNSILNKPTLAP